VADVSDLGYSGSPRTELGQDAPPTAPMSVRQHHSQALVSSGAPAFRPFTCSSRVAAQAVVTATTATAAAEDGDRGAISPLLRDFAATLDQNEIFHVGEAGRPEARERSRLRRIRGKLRRLAAWLERGGSQPSQGGLSTVESSAGVDE
jgi:hypothetical protein